MDIKRILSSTVYQIFLRTFTNEGTLKAAEKHLPEIKQLGVDIVYLCPFMTEDDGDDKFFWSERQKNCGLENPKNPYRISDYFGVDPEYGTKEDLHDFVNSVHKLGMKILFDLVYYHCGPNAAFIKEHPDFIRRGKDGNALVGEWKFPQLNYENPNLREYLYSNMEYFMNEFHVDGFRCDVGDLCPPDFWYEGFKRSRKINPDAVFLNEGMPMKHSGFDIYYGFFWAAKLKQVIRAEIPVSELVNEYRHREQKFGDCLVLRDLDNHDYANDSGDTRCDAYPGHDGVEAAFALNAFIRGIFFVYNGNEIADTHPHSIFYNRFHNSKGDMTVDWANKDSDAAKRRREVITKLISLRHELPAVALGNVEFGDCTDVLEFRRKCGEQHLYCVFNLSKEPKCVETKLPECSPCIISKGAKLGENGKLELSDWGYAVYEV